VNRKLTMAQRLLLGHLRAIGLWHDYRVEYPFAEGRRFRFDIADMTSRIGYECDGGQWSGGHMRGKALESQYEKDRLAQILGWKVFRFTNRQILNGEAKAWMAAHIEGDPLLKEQA
jgi:very-short-patch-repair endonuclease